jgi:hypothetical protein
MRILKLIALCAGLATTYASPLFAADTSSAISAKDNAVRKVNVSGRQRMLTQRMTMALCFAQAGLDSARFRGLANETSNLFHKSLAALRNGDPDDGMLPEITPEVLSELDGVQGLWATFQPLVQAGLGGDLTGDDFGVLHQTNVPLLKQSNAVVSAIELHNGDVVSDPELNSTVNVAGRQRMLSQKAAKELCFIYHGLSDADRAALAATTELFETSLQDLLFGNAALGIMTPPTEEIMVQYDMVFQLWSEVAPIYKRAAEGGNVTVDDLKVVAGLVDTILKEANAAVLMYQNL